MQENIPQELVEAWEEAPLESVRILEGDLYRRPWGQLDLSTKNAALAHLQLSDTERTEGVIFSALDNAACQVGYGGYAEERAFYQQSKHFLTPSGPRSIHLGADLFVKAKSAVIAPWQGVLHSFRDNQNYLDYGPTIILEHNTRGIKWYSLYGHLSRESLSNLEPGRRIVAGEPLAWVGLASENGGWTPHLHFQVMLDLQGWHGDYPGVCTNTDRERYLSNCPDPKLLLRPPLGILVAPK